MVADWAHERYCLSAGLLLRDRDGIRHRPVIDRCWIVFDLRDVVARA